MFGKGLSKILKIWKDSKKSSFTSFLFLKGLSEILKISQKSSKFVLVLERTIRNPQNLKGLPRLPEIFIYLVLVPEKTLRNLQNFSGILKICSCSGKDYQKSLKFERTSRNPHLPPSRSWKNSPNLQNFSRHKRTYHGSDLKKNSKFHPSLTNISQLRSKEKFKISSFIEEHITAQI